MRFFYFQLLFFFSASFTFSQELQLISPLQSPLEESSGLIYLNGKLITHNDTGGEPILYEIDTITGNVSRSVYIKNATNVDWEDLCYDDEYIYIADFGNNYGSRIDLKVYRLPISDYFMTPNDTVSVDTISFSYSDQVDFASVLFTTNFDAEAIISYDDSLLIFTKNWGNAKTYIYPIPKVPGSYELVKTDSIYVEGLITGATFNELSNTIMLSGYTLLEPFIVEINDFTLGQFSEATINRFLVSPPQGSSIQIEGIATLNAYEYYLSAENRPPNAAALYKLNRSMQSIGNIESHACKVYPNPTFDYVNLECSDFSSAEIYNEQGILQKTSYTPHFIISDLSFGLYFILIKNSKNKNIALKRLVLN